jgi:hypothetical protein
MLSSLSCLHLGYREERDGLFDNRCLSYFIESLSVNVGSSQQNVKESSLPMSAVSVGGVIVVGGRENLLRGEGHQGINIFLLESNSEPDEFQTYRKEKL